LDDEQRVIEVPADPAPHQPELVEVCGTDLQVATEVAAQVDVMRDEALLGRGVRAEGIDHETRLAGNGKVIAAVREKILSLEVVGVDADAEIGADQHARVTFSHN